MIEIKDLNKRFGDTHAVRDLNLNVPQGELFCFLGPNGAGKTTTIKMLCGLLKPTSGEIRIDGMSLAEDSVRIREITGYIPDSPYLYDRLTTTEFFLFMGDLYQVPKERVQHELEHSFDLFGLHDHRSALIKDLSHGLRQRLVYAATLLHEPRVMFIDEPFVGLDPYSIRLINDLLHEKARAGTSIFLTTHILSLAEDMADRIGIISEGSLVALGTLEELKTQTSVRGRLEDMFLKLTRPDGRDDR